MNDRAQKDKLAKIVRKYYEYSSMEENGDSTVFRVPTFHLEPEQNFNLLSKDMEKLGFLTFTRSSDIDELIVMPKPPVRSRNDTRIKLALFIATLASVLYFGYTYQISYEGSGNLIGSFLSSLLFYLLPLSVILAGREVGKYAALKRNGMQYTFPIFVPNPLGIGSMGMINTPNKPYVSKKAMIESGSFSLITGFCISIVFLIFGSLTTYSFPPSVAIVKSPVQTIGAPLIMQVVVNRLIPSNGILDPLALAGWAGIVITAFNALPLGFLDGGIIASALFGRNATYLSYASVLVIVGLGVLYPPWLVLAVFALLVGLKGPQAMNNLTRVKVNTKAIAAVSFAILIVGVAPFPFHPGINKFSTSLSQDYFLIYGEGNSVRLNVTVNNTGQSTIVPAFEILPSVNFQESGKSRSIPPGSQLNYSLTLEMAKNLPFGFNSYQLTVSSASYVQTMDLNILKVNATTALTFNNTVPYTISPGNDGNFTLYLYSSVPDNLYILSIGGPNITFSYYFSTNYSKITYTQNVQYILATPSPGHSASISVDAGNILPLSFQLQSSPTYWYIVAYDQDYNAAIAEYLK